VATLLFSFRWTKCVLESPSQFEKTAVSHSSHLEKTGSAFAAYGFGRGFFSKCTFPASQIAIPGTGIARTERVYISEPTRAMKTSPPLGGEEFHLPAGQFQQRVSLFSGR